MDREQIPGVRVRRIRRELVDSSFSVEDEFGVGQRSTEPQSQERVELVKVEIKKVIGPTPSGAAVLLGNDVKTFVVFVGFFEAAALIREMNQETPARPLTHELLQNVFCGFDVEVKQIVISSIIESTFCATL
ncbi:MAG: bifunctional nuclease domain-containing protein, partial [Planctomycetota bacterium]